MDGEIYNADELKKQFRKEINTNNLTDLELILELIVRNGTEIINLLNGLFILIIYDAIESRLTLISDRYGFRPLFYVHRGKSLIFGSELKALCSIDPQPRKLNEVGTLELFCYGSQIEDRSWLRGHLRLPPATILTADQDGIRTSVYWRYKYDEPGSGPRRCPRP